ncbi:MAG: tRNA(Ile)-lysidine synthase [Mycoplasmataceae bacterium RC_NB112A]|nr:MAG: tRNA(Ile)-lysidine synthase [Mycoplasmataceae bacterium RC_NB112A]
MLFNSKILSLNKTYIVAVSGGPDSLFSLDNLRQRGYKIIVAHVNYQKRAASSEDRKIVQDYCQKYSLLCEVYEVEKISPGNFQEQARQIRYTFFQNLAQKHHTNSVIVAHHFDDHLETYLLQKKRRSLVNYWGLPTKNKLGKIWVIRPFLSFTKQQILHYLNQKKISYAIDSTNQLPIYQRNIIRQKLTDLNPVEKHNLAQEIKEKNQQLKKIKSLFKQEKKRLIKPNNALKLDYHPQFAPEIYLRLIYEWVNSITDGFLQKSKKNYLNEIHKQLFESQKKTSIIKLGSQFKILKKNNYALLIKLK